MIFEIYINLFGRERLKIENASTNLINNIPQPPSRSLRFLQSPIFDRIVYHIGANPYSKSTMFLHDVESLFILIIIAHVNQGFALGWDDVHEILNRLSFVGFLRAGFELRRDTLNRVGRAALTMSAVPALFEIAAVTLLGPPLLGLGTVESALLGCILGAVSPAVVVPLMIDFMERGKGARKGIPTLILAASSVDDVFVIVLFTIVLGMSGGAEVQWAHELAKVPVSIGLGIVSGLIPGYLLYRLFLRYDLRPPRRTLIVLGTAIALLWVERILEGAVPVAGLLGVMAIGFIILEKEEAIAHQISFKLKYL